MVCRRGRGHRRSHDRRPRAHRAPSPTRVLYTRLVTTGEPTRPRTGSQTPSPRRARPSSGSNEVEDDVFERLARVGEAAPDPGSQGIDPVLDRGVLPRIVEAEPVTTMPTQPSPVVTAPVVNPSVVAAPVATASGAIAPGAAPPGVASPSPSPSRPVAGLRRSIVFRRPRPRVRRVTRVGRHVDTWSVFKVSLVFSAVLYLVCLVAGVLLWNVATATGTVDNIEQFFEQFGWESFEFNGGELYHNAWIAGLFVAVGLVGVAVLVATVFNLITDLVGGIRVSVLEEEVVARDPSPTGGPNVRGGSG